MGKELVRRETVTSCFMGKEISNLFVSGLVLGPIFFTHDFGITSKNMLMKSACDTK